MAWTRKLPSGKWQGCYRDLHNKTRTAGAFIRKQDAKDAAAAQESKMRRGDWIDPSLGRQLFSEWAQTYMQSAFNQRTSSRARDESYFRVHILPAFAPAAIGEIEPVAIQKWVTSLSTKLAPASVAIAYRLLSQIMRAAEDAGCIGRSPCRGIRLPRVDRHEMRFLSAAELERLADAAPARFRALVVTAGYLGLRWGEVTGLKRARLNLLQGTLEVSEILVEVAGVLSFGEPKTKASRRLLSLPSFLVEELQHHLEDHSTHPDLMFAGRDGGALYRGAFRRRVWLPAVETAGLSPLRFHDLRHTAAALMIASGTHPKVVQSRLGHASITTTLDLYGHKLPGLEEAVVTGLEEAHRAARAAPAAAHLLHGSMVEETSSVGNGP